MVIYGLLIVFAIIYLVPLVVMVMTSLKPLDEVPAATCLPCPQHLTFEPWTKAWGTACVGLTCAGIKGYLEFGENGRPGGADFDAAGRAQRLRADEVAVSGHKLVFGMMLFACFIPFQSVLIPMATILGKLGRSGNRSRTRSACRSASAIRP